MGCDLHLHVEIKVGSEWLHYNHPRIERDYDLFARMAGVRAGDSEVEPIAGLKGLPDGISPTTKICARRWGLDGHSHSWFNQDEIEALALWCLKRQPEDPFAFERIFGFLFGNRLYNLKRYPGDYAPEISDVRFVFWFDN